MNKFACFVLLFGAVCGVLTARSDQEVTDDIAVADTCTKNSPHVLTVESGQTDTYSGVISGKTYLSIRGGGTFVPINPDNTFRGNLMVDNGIVRLDSALAIRGDLKAKKVCTLYHNGGSKESAALKQYRFNDDGATFNCNFTHSAVADTGYAYAPLLFMKSCTLSGSFSCTSKELMIRDDPSTQPTVTFENSVSVSDSSLALYPTGTFKLKSKVSATTLYCSRTDAGKQGTVELYSSSNVFSTVDFGYSTVKLVGENVISNATVNFNSSSDRYATTGLGELFVCSNQHVKAVTTPYTQVHGHIVSAEPVDFVLQGLSEYASGERIPRVSFDGAVSLVKEGDDLEQRFSYTTNTTTGAVIVRGGTLRFYNTTVFPNASALIVEKGFLDLRNVNTSRRTFASVTNIVVGAAGEISFGDSDSEPFTNMPAISVTSPGRFITENKTSFTVQSSAFVVDGVDQGGGTFTAATHPDVLGEGITVKVKRPAGFVIIVK